MEEIIQEALDKGMEMHVAGEFDLAGQLYESVIKLQPNHADANHNMGLLKLDMGNDLEALPFLQTALHANTTIAQFWLSYIKALIKLDRRDEAARILDLSKENGFESQEFVELTQLINTATEIATVSEREVDKPSQSKPYILDSMKLDQALRLAEKKAKQGDAEEALEIYKDILAKFPKNKRAQQGLAALKKAKQSPPKEMMNELINLYQRGQLSTAVEKAQVLIQQYPDAFLAWNLLGAAAAQTGQLDKAIIAFERVLAIKPDYAEAYNNMGNALKEQGKLEEAIEFYSKALAIKPDYDQAYYNMGVILQEQAKLDEAINFYEKALAIKPDYAEAYNNIGNALKQQGKLEEAIEAYIKALELESDYADAYINMGIALRGVAFEQPNFGLQKIIFSLLNKKSFVRPKDIASAAISLLKFEPKLNRHLQTSSLAEVKLQPLEVITDLSELPLLLRLMSVCPLPDLDIENLFGQLRESLLLSISYLTGSTKELEVQSALALQCFINDYIYIQSEHEEKAIAALEVAIKQALSKGEQPSPQSILCLSSYGPLNQYEWSSSLMITDEIEKVFTRQVTEPHKEAKLKAGLSMLEDITDEVSSKVRTQYEVSPYPRWENLLLSLNPMHISKLVKELNLNLFEHEIENIQSPNVLIAGCGTGQHSIETAVKLKNCKVLAVDLSGSSLSYAKRKTEELRIPNIDYIQADILDLGKLRRQFDIVESAGVLHHMQDPIAGWRVLVDCLKQGGLMKIGLYSESARQHIVKMRREISEAGIGSNDAAMKSFRAMVITSDQSHHKQILNSPDFYSLSELKDLLFHVQEHRFTIAQIKNCLFELGLKFCGFEAAELVAHFKLTYTGASDLYDLDKWQAYEKANPRAFARMYQFWCQKVA